MSEYILYVLKAHDINTTVIIYQSYIFIIFIFILLEKSQLSFHSDLNIYTKLSSKEK